ncbi:MAG: porin [Rhodospirillales bacterium]|nr:porin [Rhodospirillales bacterium]
MSNFRMMLLSTAAIGLTAAAVTPASAGEVEKSASVGGHVARMVGVLNDAETSNLLHDDSNRSGSRIIVSGEAVSESMTFGARMQIRPDGGGNANPAAVTANAINFNQSYVYASSSMGTLALGAQDSAGADFAPHSSSTSGAAGHGSNSGGAPFGGAFLVKGTKRNEETAGTTVGGNGTYSGGGGTSIKYASPDLNGFAFAVSGGGGAAEGGAAENVSGNISYGADYNGTAVGAHYTYISTSGDSTTIDTIQNAGLGFELANGINAAVGWGDVDMATGSALDPRLYFVAVGYDTSAVSDLGETSVAVTYTDDSEGVADTGDYTQWSLNLEQDLTDYGTTIFGGIAKQEYSITGTNYEDIVTTWLGLKVAF